MKKTIVKICGITNLTDAKNSLEQGADILGFIFYEKSPRYILPEKAAEIISTLKINFKFESAGVFVNPLVKTVNDTIDKASIDILQFHGEESPSFIKNFNRKSIKAFRIKNTADLSLCDKYEDTDFLLLDAFSKDSYGGTGTAFDWSILSDFKYREKLFLSGGININNVKDALLTVRPYAIDLSSSLEKKPGIKDKEKINDFFYIFNKISVQ